MYRQTQHAWMAAIAGLFTVLSFGAHADLYLFTIDGFSDYGDPSRSIAILSATPSGGRISVYIPLVEHVHGSPPIQDYLEHDAPATGAVPDVPSLANILQMGTELPRCQAGTSSCGGALPWAEMYAMSLSPTTWGHFEGSTWIPDPSPPPVSFCAPTLFGLPGGSDCFTMVRVPVPEPPVFVLMALGLLLLGARRVSPGLLRGGAASSVCNYSSRSLHAVIHNACLVIAAITAMASCVVASASSVGRRRMHRS